MLIKEKDCTLVSKGVSDDFVLKLHEKTSNQYLLNAFILQRRYYNQMIKFIQRVIQ